MEKPRVGDRLFRLNVGNAARRGGQKLTPVVVVKVGTKFFSVSPDEFADRTSSHMWTEFKLADWREKTNYTPNHALYRTEQEWLDEQEFHRTWTTLRETFASYGSPKTALSLGQLRRIVAILNEERK